MEEHTTVNLCRICLQNGASLPIFEVNDDRNYDIQSKLSLCLKEKIEDMEGYPRFICKICSKILDDACNFINKYKSSCKILQSGLHVVKQENVDISDLSCHEAIQSEEEIEIHSIKNEYNYDPESDKEDDLSDHHEEFFKPLLQLKLKIENENLPLVIKKTKSRRPKTNTKEVTNNIASSILEGQFMWNGDKWCKCPKNKLSTQEKIKLLTPKTENENRKRITIKVPKPKKPDPPKLCDLCGEVFKNAEKLNLHKKKVHFKNPVRCLHCLRHFVSNYYLKRHMKRKHEDNKKFICDICGRGFAFKGELSSHHKNVHDKQARPKKQFKCQFCSKIYKCAKSVIVHERSSHTGDRPATCSVCSSSFYHEDYLKEHMRLHTGETPFKCPICGRGYAQRGNMKSHLRIHRRSELDAATLSKLRPNYLRLLKA